jgi:hypothetical protein
VCIKVHFKKRFPNPIEWNLDSEFFGITENRISGDLKETWREWSEVVKDNNDF